MLNALISLCERVSEQSGIRVHRKLKGPVPQLTPEVELAIYRIAQEALTNVMRHSHATDVTVSLGRDGWGAGALASPTTAAACPSTSSRAAGLTGMRERAMLIGAELRIERDGARGDRDAAPSAQRGRAR